MAYIDRIKRKGILFDINDYRLSDDDVNFLKGGTIATLNSPTFSGTPTVPTPTGENTEAIVNVDYLNNNYTKGPATSGNNHIPLFDQESGKILKDSGLSIDEYTQTLQGHVSHLSLPVKGWVYERVFTEPTTTVSGGSVTVDEEKFVEAYPSASRYIFTYDGTNWIDKNSTAVVLSVIGITLTGTPATNNTIEVKYEDQGPFHQIVTIPGSTIHSKIDVQADKEALSQMLADEISAIYIDNNNNVLTAYAIGENKPTTTLSVQICRTEVTT